MKKNLLIVAAFSFGVVLSTLVWYLYTGSKKILPVNSVIGSAVQADSPVADDSVADPSRVPTVVNTQHTIKLFYYSADKDKDQTGNILCSRQGLVSVERKIPVTITPIQDAVRLLLRGELTPVERAQGITTEFPLLGLVLKGADLKNSVLTLDLTDPNNKTSGGACRAGILWAQIEATAKQFPEVKEVKFKSENLFQP